MRLTTRHVYGSPPAAVWAMFIDPAFRDDVCAATGASSWTVDIDADDQGGVISISRTIPAQLSKAVTTLVGDSVTVVQTETWEAADGDRTRRGTVILDVVGQPAAMRGTSLLAAGQSETVMAVDGELEVRIPLLGGRLERELAKALSAGLAQEHEVGRRYLS